MSVTDIRTMWPEGNKIHHERPADSGLKAVATADPCGWHLARASFASPASSHRAIKSRSVNQLFGFAKPINPCTLAGTAGPCGI